MSNESNLQAYNLGNQSKRGKVPGLALLKNPTKNNNQSDTDIDMEVFKWKYKSKTIFGSSRNIE